MTDSKRTKPDILKVFSKIFDSNRSHMVLEDFGESRIFKRIEISSNNELIYVPWIAYNSNAIKDFSNKILSVYDGHEINEASDNLGQGKRHGLFIELLNTARILKSQMYRTNAESFLSIEGYKNLANRIKPYLKEPGRKNIYNFILNETWDDTFIVSLAALYVSNFYYEIIFKSSELEIGKVYSTLCQKAEIPINAISHLEYFGNCVVRFCNKLELEILKPNYYDHIQDEIKWDGRIMIPWECVTFKNGYFLIEHPRMFQKGESGMAYKYKCSDSKTAFNYIKKSFMAKLPPIIADCSRGKVTNVFNVGDISVCVTALESGVLPPKVKIQRPNVSSPALKISRDDYIKHKAEYKSVYLDYLSELIREDNVIYFCEECRVTTSSGNVIAYEDAFLFCLTADVLLYENVLDDRASVLFYINHDCSADAIKAINDYFSSDIMENKRQKLAEDMTQFVDSGIKGYKRIYHTSFHDWKNELESALSV